MVSFRDMLRLWGALCVIFIGTVSGVQAGPNPVEIHATGIAYVSGANDTQSARHRALTDALVTAALAGGAKMQGYTAQFNGRIIADLSLLQAAGRVMSHRVVAADLINGMWQVKIAARVGAPLPTQCSGARSLTISATPPQIDLRPSAPAWAMPIASQLVRDVFETLRAHPATTLDDVAPIARHRVAASLSYTALTRGTVPTVASNHRMSQTLKVSREKNDLSLVLTLEMIGPDGEQITRRFARSTPIPKGGVTGVLTGHSRRQAEHALTDGIIGQIKTALDQLACQAPQARLAYSQGKLHVPIGKKHGLTRASIAVVEDRNDSFGVLQITSLNNREAVLEPIDPTRPPQGFAGTQVYFIRAGQ